MLTVVDLFSGKEAVTNEDGDEFWKRTPIVIFRQVGHFSFLNGCFALENGRGGRLPRTGTRDGVGNALLGAVAYVHWTVDLGKINVDELVKPFQKGCDDGVISLIDLIEQLTQCQAVLLLFIQTYEYFPQSEEVVLSQLIFVHHFLYTKIKLLPSLIIMKILRL